MLDLLISNGTVVDGSGKKGLAADVGILGDKIASLFPPGSDIQAKRRIDASSMVVLPGFIDTHSHSDLWVLEEPSCEAKILQGVTTEIVGNCGKSPAPIWGKGGDLFKEYAAFLLGRRDMDWGWERVSSYLEEVSKTNTAGNIGLLFGYNNLRASATGEFSSRPCTPEEIHKMKEAAAQAMKDGALGVSTGLIYPPGFWAPTEEILEVARAIAESGGVYVTHMRNESDYLLSALEESINICLEAGTALHVSHFKTGGGKNGGKMKAAICLLDQAQSVGLKVSADVYPYNYGSGYLQTVLSPAFFEGGQSKLVERLKDPQTRKLARDSLRYDDSAWGRCFISSVASPENSWVQGKTIKEIADTLNKEPVETAFDLMVEEHGKVLMVMGGKGKKDEDIQNALRYPNSVIGSDGIPRCDSPSSHPRTYSTFLRAISEYVLDKKVMAFEEMIRKMTSLPAEIYGLANRGRVREGWHADLVIMDPQKIEDRSTIQEPTNFTSGIQYVLVNGGIVVDGAVQTSLRPGRVLTR